MSGNERAWVDGLRSGDVACFDAVYHAYSPRLRAFLSAMCGRADIADELLQETLDEEGAADKKLTEICEGEVLSAAAGVGDAKAAQGVAAPSKNGTTAVSSKKRAPAE